MRRLSKAIIILSLVASLFILMGNGGINYVSAQTVTPSPTATATPTPTPTVTVTPTPSALPDSGVSGPTLLALGFGAVLLLISLSLAL